MLGNGTVLLMQEFTMHQNAMSVRMKCAPINKTFMLLRLPSSLLPKPQLLLRRLPMLPMLRYITMLLQ
jgi:hypothetical protein